MPKKMKLRWDTVVLAHRTRVLKLFKLKINFSTEIEGHELVSGIVIFYLKYLFSPGIREVFRLLTEKPSSRVTIQE